MSNSFFYLNVPKDSRNATLIEELENYASNSQKQTYVIDRPLGQENKYVYEYLEKLIVLITNHKILIVNFGKEDNDDFREFMDDFVEDLGSISDKFKYKDIIGRPRQWRKELIEEITVSENLSSSEIQRILSSSKINNTPLQRKVELLISLLTGSINDIERVQLETPSTLLDKIKKKIILFDGDQTRFIYEELHQKTITVQGLSGTGKTELLLHKLKDIYVSNKNVKIMFTCHNKILADSLRNRIPEFFNFMKVEEQIAWEKQLWCVSAWGSKNKKHSGAYAYICSFYNINFYRFNDINSFDLVCHRALQELSLVGTENLGYAFDYTFIDESQDFPSSFLELCKRVTKEAVYIAGDIFQNIFQYSVDNINPDYLLNKCYRTDPRTLMFAHAVGMGLFETPKLGWLTDEQWQAYGYIINKLQQGKVYQFSREPLRRFEDLGSEGVESVELIKTNTNKDERSEAKIIEIIKNIRQEHPSVCPDDIGIIFIDSEKYTYMTADKLEQLIAQEFGWSVNKAYETKEALKDRIFISNKNNVKGLEFPFVICVTMIIKKTKSYRNSLYMMLTRSFIKSYLLTSEDKNMHIDQNLLPELEKGLNIINLKGYFNVKVPSKEEQDNMMANINISDHISLEDFIYGIFDELNIPKEVRPNVWNMIKPALSLKQNYLEKYETIKELIESNYRSYMALRES